LFSLSQAAHDWLEDAFKGSPAYGVDLVGQFSLIVDDLAAA
jgi:hypothetical protein